MSLRKIENIPRSLLVRCYRIGIASKISAVDAATCVAVATSGKLLYSAQ